MDFSFQFDWQAAIDSIPFLLKGIPYTLLISFGGLLIGFVLGIIFGLLSINKKWFLRWPATAYIEIFRGTPILVQVLFIFYGLPDLIGSPINPLTAGIAAIAELIPMTWPLMLSSGPPELPGLIAASVWIAAM